MISDHLLLDISNDDVLLTQGLIQDFTSGILFEKSNNLEKSNMINLKNLTSNSVWDSFFYKGNLCPVLCTVLSISK